MKDFLLKKWKKEKRKWERRKKVGSVGPRPHYLLERKRKKGEEMNKG